MRRIMLVFFFVVVVAPRTCSASNVEALFLLGDSVLDSGTNVWFANSSDFSSPAMGSPYGETFFGFPTGRFSDGRTLGDFLAMQLDLPLTRPYLEKNGVTHKYGANFASAGSRLLGTSSARQGIVSMKLQVEQLGEMVTIYKQRLGEDQAKAFLNKSMVLIAVGGNDVQEYLSNATQQSQLTRQMLVNLMIDHYRTLLVKIYAEGLRKIVVLGLGPLGCSPIGRYSASSRGRGSFTSCLEPANELATNINAALRQLTFSMNNNRSLSEIQLVLAKPYDLLMAVINSPFRYGFTEARMACCGGGPFRAAAFCSRNNLICLNPERFLFWDLAHFTEAACSFMFGNFWGGSFFFVEPYNLYRLATS